MWNIFIKICNKFLGRIVILTYDWNKIALIFFNEYTVDFYIYISAGTMGKAVSRNLDLSSNEYCLKFVGQEAISTNDPYWNRFLTFNIVPPINMYL